MRVFKWTSLSVLAICWVHFSHGQDKVVLWGTHGGLNSPNYWFTGTEWTSSPSTEQLLQDFAGNALTVTGHTTPNNDFDGDLIELGFFASALGTSGNIGGTGGEADTPSTNLFEGTWIPLTTKTYIGQDWGTVNTANIASEIAKETVDAGEFEFKSDFTRSGGSWNDYVNHNYDEDSSTTPEFYTLNDDYLISGPSGDNQPILSDHLNAITSGTKLGIRFYDSNTKSNGTTSYNTIMNDSWTWGGSGAPVEMFLHKESSPNDLADGLKFEFDNSDYASVSEKAGSGVNSQSSDFVTTITYWTGLSNLSMTGTNQDTVLSGVTGSSTITGGNDNKLTLNVNGEGTTSNAYSFSGDIVDNGSGNGGLEVIKTGTAAQTLTGNITLDDDADSFLNIHEGKLVIDRSANTNDFTSEYIVGEVGSTLEFNNDSTFDLISLGFSGTSSAKDFKGTLELTGTTDGHRILVSSGSTASDYENEQILSGSLKASGLQYLWKDGVGKLRLTGDSSSEYANDFGVHNGTLIIGDGVDGGADFHANTTFEIVKGKLEIAENETISSTNVIRGAGSGKDMVGGKGTVGSLKIGNDFATNEITVVSPGHGISSSLSSNASQQQVSLANGTDSIGTFTVTNLELNDGGIYDWEISDFTVSAGSWDVLAYNTLTFEGGQAFDINIFGLQSDGTAGMNSGNIFEAKTGTGGFKFIDGPGHGSITWGGFGAQAAGNVDNLFNINQQGWSHYNHHYGTWGVYYDGAGDFYLEFSAVPEPSTYVMVTGLLMLPGYNFVRRMRKKKSLSKDENEEIVS